MRGEATSIVTKKLNKLKEIVSSKKKKALEVTAGKFVSNGSLLSQNGLKNENGGGPTSAAAELQNKIGGEHYQWVFKMGIFASLPLVLPTIDLVLLTGRVVSAYKHTLKKDEGLYQTCYPVMPKAPLVYSSQIYQLRCCNNQ